MPSRFPAIPSVPAHVDPTLRYIFESLRENVEILRGVRGDPRDKAMSAQELASIYRRLQSTEEWIASTTQRTTRVASVGATCGNDRCRMRGYVVTSPTDVVGAIDADCADDAAALTGKNEVLGTVAATTDDDTGLFGGGVFSGGITGTIAKTLANDFPAVFNFQISGTLSKTLTGDTSAIAGTVA